LLVCSVEVLRLRQRAKNMEPILSAFEDDGWAPGIDNPLPDCGNQPARDRLHNGVYRLNLRLGKVIRFRMNGTGEGVSWEFVHPTDPLREILA
jgi:hypothetical protein